MRRGLVEKQVLKGDEINFDRLTSLFYQHQHSF